MANYDSNYEIAQEISARIGNSPVPFDSVYSICLAIYQELGGTEETFDSVYSILLEILPLATEIGHVIDDNAISSGKTWSSSKINSELNGKQNTLAAGEGIIISGDTISATATGGDDAIEEVSELPNASENKDKFFRLDNGAKDVYAAKLLSSETITTNRLPDAQQIDKAYLYEIGDSIYYYKGSWRLSLNDGNIDAYGWINGDNEEWFLHFTQNNAENSNINTKSFLLTYDNEGIITIDIENHNITYNGTLSDFEWDNTDGLDNYDIVALIPATYNAPESAQIGNAYITDDNPTSYTYDGTEITLIVSDGQFTVYRWYDSEGSLFSTKQASNIYYAIQNDGDVQSYISDVKFVGEWDLESFTKSGNTYTNTSISYSEIYWYNITNMGATAFYIPQLNAPDSEQVDNAYIDDVERGEQHIYSGIRKTIVVNDGTLYAYFWGEDDGGNVGNWPYATIIPANEIYGNENVRISALDDYTTWTVSGDTYTNMDISLSDIEENNISPIGTDNEIVSTVKYERTETTEEWGWEKVATEGDVNNLSGELTDLSNELVTKANKVDYVIPMDMTTQSLDWSALNVVTSTGMYHCVARVDYMGVQMDMGCYYLSVVGTSNGRILQTLFSVENSSVAQYGETRMSLYSRSSADNGSTWTNVTQLYLPSINDGAVTSAQALETVYSRSKVDSLISALEARIAALENPNT